MTRRLTHRLRRLLQAAYRDWLDYSREYEWQAEVQRARRR